MSSLSAAVVAACVMLAVAVCLQCVTPVAEAAVSPARRHDKPVRPRPVAADQPSNQTAATAADDYDDGNANYDDDYEDSGNYHKKLPVATADDNSMDII